MSAYLIYSRDSYLKEIFLENQIHIYKPQQILRYSLRKVKFREIAEKLFNFSLFGQRTIYFLEECQTLREEDLDSLRRIDFKQLSDLYIFCLEGPAYWKEFSRWEGISGVEIRELHSPSPQEMRRYLERAVARRLSSQGLNFLLNVYAREKDFKVIIDAVTKASLFHPEGEEIPLEVLKKFLEEKEPAEINILYTRIKNKDLTLALSGLQALIEQGFKPEAVFSILVYKLVRDPQLKGEDLRFILELERKQKTQKVDIFFLLVELLFYFCQQDVLTLGLGLET